MKSIKGYEGLYSVTSCGKVYSHKSKKFLKQHDNEQGYLYVQLWKDGIGKWHRVHRLVADTYIPNPDNLPEVNHKDEVKEHNWMNNLEWCDHKYNMNYGSCATRSAQKRSTKIRCVETGEEFESIMDCERKTGLHNGNISEHLRGIKGRSHVGGYHFERIE